MWIQSYQPENPALTQLIAEGYSGFAEAELKLRNQAGMPPFKPMAMLRADALAPQDAYNFLLRCREHLAAIEGIEILGPVAAPLARIANRTRYQTMLIGQDRRALHAALNRLDAPRSTRELRWSIDVDPYDSL